MFRLSAPVKIVLSLLIFTAFFVGLFWHLEKYDCVVQKETRILRGDSLSGLFEDGTSFTILYGYYHCHSVKRGDVVVYSYAGNSVPIVKVVKGLPGDTFDIQEAPEGGYRLLINDAAVRNAVGSEYVLNVQAARLLRLYVDDYKGRIPTDAYLILGNLVEGSTDSSRFGLVDKRDILGKAVSVVF